MLRDNRAQVYETLVSLKFHNFCNADPARNGASFKSTYFFWLDEPLLWRVFTCFWYLALSFSSLAVALQVFMRLKLRSLLLLRFILMFWSLLICVIARVVARMVPPEV